MGGGREGGLASGGRESAALFIPSTDTRHTKLRLGWEQGGREGKSAVTDFSDKTRIFLQQVSSDLACLPPGCNV